MKQSNAKGRWLAPGMMTRALLLLVLALSSCAVDNGDDGPTYYNTTVGDVQGTYTGRWRIDQADADEAVMHVAGNTVTLSKLPCEGMVRLLLDAQGADEAVATIETPNYTVVYDRLGSSYNSEAYELTNEPYDFSFTVGGVRHNVHLDFRVRSQGGYYANTGMFVVILHVEKVTVSDGESVQVMTRDWTLTFYPTRKEV